MTKEDKIHLTNNFKIKIDGEDIKKKKKARKRKQKGRIKTLQKN